MATAATVINRQDVSGLILKTTPPRAPRHLLARARLGLNDEQFRERPIIAVQASPGFGKTSLLAQWRREFLAHGAAVAWLSVDGRDDPTRFLLGLVQSVRVGCGRPEFGRHLMEASSILAGDLEGITAWLAEVAQTTLDVVLIVDEADRLPEATLLELSYLLHNTPQNLRVVVAARSGLESAIVDLCAYGQCLSVNAESLRFRLDETMALVRSRFGTKIDADACARLHDMAEGWPLGLQLAFSAVEGGGDPRAAVEALLVRSGNQKDQLMGGLVANLARDDSDFLTRISIADILHPDLCRALTGCADAQLRLARLSRDTPFFVLGDDSDWSRLHTLARDVFRARAAALPTAEQQHLHMCAMEWFAAHSMLEESARHAHAAGQNQAAFDLAEKCLYEAAMQGRVVAVRDWLALLPEAELDRRPRLLLAAAWVLALSERHGEAENLVRKILDKSAVAPELRYECALISSGAAYFADDPDRCIELFAPWIDAPPVSEPRLVQVHTNRLAAVAIINGDPAQARRHLQLAAGGDRAAIHPYALQWGEFFKGLSYLWEGQVMLCEGVLSPALAKADSDFGRRHPLACMQAALLAAAVYERDRVDEAAALLANRLDVLERSSAPETALYGYRTAARIAAAQGVEHRALDLLEELSAIGDGHHMPRLSVVSLLEQVRLHAARYRFETCRELTARMDTVIGRCDLDQRPLWAPMIRLLQSMAHIYTAVAAQRWPEAIRRLDDLVPRVEAMRVTRYRIEIMALKAFALDRNSDRGGRALLDEAMTLAQTFGLIRTVVDTHPALADWARRVVEERDRELDVVRPAAPAKPLRPMPEASAGPRALPSMVLTPKEREVLELLARNLSNKEIAQAMAVGEETVKWHLKNLFGKLDAGTRKHAVRRARLLGLLEVAD